MPIVPVIDSPTVSPQDGGLQPFSAGGGVEPVKNFAPEQGAKMGAAVQGAGQQMIKIGEMIQDQIYDANTKAAVSWYTSQASKTLYDKETGYLNTLGIKSKDKYGETAETFNKIEESALIGLQSDLEKRMFSNAIATHKQSFAAQMDTHVVKQMRVYGAGEADALRDQFISLAITTKDLNQREQSALNAITQAEAKADLLELPKDSSQRKEMISDVNNKITNGITNDLITKEDFSTAKAYLEDQRLQGKVDNKDYQSLMRTINVGNEKQEATNIADKIFTGSTSPKNTDRDTIIDYIIKGHEGGYTENDAGRGPTNLGVNGRSNGLTPDQVKNLTMDQAREIYRKNYWDKIKGDKLDPSIRLMVYDTAVNMSPEVANKILKQSGGDLDKFAELRKKAYEKIAENNPKEKAEFLSGWKKRVDTMLNLSKGGSESLQDQIDKINKIENKDVRDMARSKVISLNNTRDSIIADDYKKNFDKAYEIAAKKPDSWLDIPPEIMSKIKPQDQQKLRNAADRQSDQETLLYVQTHPESWAPEKLSQYRWMLSETDYRNFLTKGTAPNYGEKVLEVGYDQDQLKQKLLDFGLEKLVHPKKDSAEEKERIRLNSQLEQNIDLAQKTAQRKLSLDEKNKLIDNLIRPVKVKAVEGWFFKEDTTMDKPAFQVKSKLNIIIPPEKRKEIEQKLKTAGVRYDENTIIDSYLMDR